MQSINALPGYKSDASADWTRALANKNVEIYGKRAKQIADQYNDRCAD